MRRAALLLTLASSIISGIPTAASAGLKKEPCADIPLESLFQQVAPKSARDHAWEVPTISQHAEIDAKATCSSITEPLATVRADESSALENRFCRLLRSELAGRGGDVTEGRSAVESPPDTQRPSYTSCTLFTENAGQTVSIQAIYLPQSDHSTRVMVTVNAW